MKSISIDKSLQSCVIVAISICSTEIIAEVVTRSAAMKSGIVCRISFMTTVVVGSLRRIPGVQSRCVACYVKDGTSHRLQDEKTIAGSTMVTSPRRTVKRRRVPKRPSGVVSAVRSRRCLPCLHYPWLDFTNALLRAPRRGRKLLSAIHIR